jgi:aminoglycoside phosphotransferase (APT) family kinase protein
VPDAALRELVERLCTTAGAASVAAIEPARFGSFNRNLVVTDTSGERFVMRLYRDRPEPHTATARARRERWVLDTLAAAGVPVPQPLAWSEEERTAALLLPLVEGEALGALAARVAAGDAVGAWHAAGRAFARVHGVDSRRASDAGCEAIGITAPYASRGPYHYDEALAHLAAVADARRDLPAPGPLLAVVEEARPLYERAPVVLCQYDAHLWQFLLLRRSREWECTAILDWEHADLDDPDWDLAQLDVFRFEPVGPTPTAFFAGYGRTPLSPLYALYRVERAAWVLAAHAGGAAWLDGSVGAAERFLLEAHGRTDELRRQITGALGR